MLFRSARARVSRQTVSNALNRPEIVRPATLARVRQAVAELGYRPMPAARQLRSGQARTIAFAMAVHPLPGTGVTDRTIVEQVFREVRAFRIYDGPTEVHKWSLAKKIKRDWKAGRA